MREPFVARFPGRIPEGLVSGRVACTMDIMPTVARFCNAALPASLSTGSTRPLLTGQAESLEREALLYFDDWQLKYARLGKWKLHVAGTIATLTGHRRQPAG